MYKLMYDPTSFTPFFCLPLMQYILARRYVRHYIFSLKTAETLGIPCIKRSYIVLFFSNHFFRYDHKQKS